MLDLQLIIAAGMFMALVLITAMMTFGIRRMVIPIQKMQVAMQRASLGNLSERVICLHSKDEVGQIIFSFNGLMNAIQIALSNISEVLHKLSTGQTSARVEMHFEGDLDKLKQTVNESIALLDTSFKLINSGVEAIGQGNFDYKIPENSNIQGTFLDMVLGTQNTLNELNQAVGEILQLSKQMSEGDFTGQLTGELPGALKQLQTNLNRSMSNVLGAMNEITGIAQHLSEGDLRHRGVGKHRGKLGELQSAINHSIDRLADTVSTVQDSSQTVNQMTAELLSATSELSDRTQQQAVSLQSSASTVATLALSLNESEKRVRSANQHVLDVSQKAISGHEVMDSAVSAMNRIEAASSKITDITQLIDSISFQTNLLALNAAVEAARAGEHGRGFAVVASEVRALAQKSATAAKDIKQLVDTTSQEIKNGTQLVASSGAVFSEIVKGVGQVESLVNEISQTIQSQAAGIREINNSIASMEAAGQQNAALVEENTASSEHLSHIADQLIEKVSHFKQ